jgi:DNA sulfur modification protein DndD
MKLIRAEFKNFRLLRNLSITFNTDDRKKLTVIRAENESGKTTILNALQWALYGDDALPGRRREYRLHPIDWNASEGARVPISVTVNFETTSPPTRRGQRGVISTRYSIIRSTYETVRDDSWDVGPTNVQLFRLTETGSEEMSPPEAIIREELPTELREVFFTDGDRTLSFIEAEVAASTKRRRVEGAIRSLLGLDVIEAALSRVKKTGTEVNRRVKEAVPNQEVAGVAQDLDELREARDQLEEKIRDADEQFTAFDERYASINKQIEDILAKGNRENLAREVANVRKSIKNTDEQLTQAHKLHAELCRSLLLSRDLMGEALGSSFAILDELRDQGKIPNSTIPVLEERLNEATCICGEHIAGQEPDALRRREHIQGLIESSRRADQLQIVMTNLYFASKPFQPVDALGEDGWVRKFNRVAEHRGELSDERDRLGKWQKSLEAQIAQIPDSDVQGLQQMKREYSTQRDQHNSDRAHFRSDLHNVNRQIIELDNRYQSLLRRQRRGAEFMADFEVVQDIQTILTRAFERLTTDELSKVSTQMNSIFLEMIGADPSQGAIIQSAVVTEDFDITVYGLGGRELNPDNDLNGASRRCLTLAFILALTKVSEVKAANVIDTPLGMMSGYVKTSALTTAIRESSQLILFLTRSEIAGCEGILDAEAANVITLTNPAHYPTMLVNDPGAKERAVMLCDCNHRQECNICQRVVLSEPDPPN